ncbi:hypothetical protein D9M70_469180 [compost metagenome]
MRAKGRLPLNFIAIGMLPPISTLPPPLKERPLAPESVVSSVTLLLANLPLAAMSKAATPAVRAAASDAPDHLRL